MQLQYFSSTEISSYVLVFIANEACGESHCRRFSTAVIVTRMKFSTLGSFMPFLSFFCSELGGECAGCQSVLLCSFLLVHICDQGEEGIFAGPCWLGDTESCKGLTRWAQLSVQCTSRSEALVVLPRWTRRRSFSDSPSCVNKGVGEDERWSKSHWGVSTVHVGLGQKFLARCFSYKEKVITLWGGLFQSKEEWNLLPDFLDFRTWCFSVFKERKTISV